jgi:hypothetical protein
MSKLKETGQAGALSQIEITPAMIEAGDRAIRQYGGIADPSELASRVYTAMQAAQG